MVKFSLRDRAMLSWSFIDGRLHRLAPRAALRKLLALLSWLA